MENSVKEQSVQIHTSFNQNPNVATFAPKKRKRMVDEEAERNIREIETNGFVILNNVLSKEEVNELRNECEKYLDAKGRNIFEGGILKFY